MCSACTERSPGACAKADGAAPTRRPSCGWGEEGTVPRASPAGCGLRGGRPAAALSTAGLGGPADAGRLAGSCSNGIDDELSRRPTAAGSASKQRPSGREREATNAVACAGVAVTSAAARGRRPEANLAVAGLEVQGGVQHADLPCRNRLRRPGEALLSELLRLPGQPADTVRKQLEELLSLLAWQRGAERRERRGVAPARGGEVLVRQGGDGRRAALGGAGHWRARRRQKRPGSRAQCMMDAFRTVELYGVLKPACGKC